MKKLLHGMINGGILVFVVARQQALKKKSKKVVDFELITWYDKKVAFGR